MIIGADASSDRTILDTSANLYGSYKLKRVYYSAFSPIPDASRSLPLAAPPLMREHRLYQADWLLRFYGFSVEEIAGGAAACAARHRPQARLGVAAPGLVSAGREPCQPRAAPARAGPGQEGGRPYPGGTRHRLVRSDDLGRLHVSPSKVLPFVVLPDHRPKLKLLDSERLLDQPVQPPSNFPWRFDE